MNKFTRVLAVAGISGALALGGAGAAQASTDHGQRVGPDKAQTAKRHDRNSRDRSRSGRDKNHNSRDRSKSKDKGSHKHERNRGKNHK